jgi:hypothetical protein
VRQSLDHLLLQKRLEDAALTKSESRMNGGAGQPLGVGDWPAGEKKMT